MQGVLSGLNAGLLATGATGDARLAIDDAGSPAVRAKGEFDGSAAEARDER